MIARVIRALMIIVLLTTVPRAAAAQASAPVEVSAGYSFVNEAKDDISLPAGWMAGAGVRLADWLSVVGEVGRNSRTTDVFGSTVRISVITAMAGARASARIGRLTEFAQVLAGVVRGSGTSFGFTETTTVLGLQPGVGVNYPLSQTLSARAQLDARFIRSQPNGNNASYEYRVSAGLVYAIRR